MTPDWQEPALTSQLVTLLDGRKQDLYALDYPLKALARDIKLVEPQLSLRYEVETHQYNQQVERYVNQADLGVVIRYEDSLLPERSYSRSYLLQAKRAYEADRTSLLSESASFEFTSVAQHARITRLREILGDDAVLYLLYTPWGSALADGTESKLRHLRNVALSGSYFSSWWPHVEFLNESAGESTAWFAQSHDAGVFVCMAEKPPANIAQVHARVFDEHWPLAWFLVRELVRTGSNRHADVERQVRGLVTGDQAAIAVVLAATGDNLRDWTFLPAHTLLVTVSIGQRGDDGLADLLAAQPDSG